MNLGQGAPEVTGEVTNYGSLSNGRLMGVNIFLGKTEMGEPGKLYLCRTPDDYYKNLGGIIAGTDFPYLMLRGLAQGGPCYIGGLFHYTDPTDASTVVGTKATGTLTKTISTVVNSAVFTAKNVGAYGNRITISSVLAASGDADLRDITITLTGNGFPDIVQLIEDVAKVPTTDQKAAFNATARHVQLGTVTVTIPEGVSVTLTTGAKDHTTVVDADVIGDATAKTGIFSADIIRDAVRIAVPDFATNPIDLSIAAYCDARKDMMAGVRTPVGLDAEACIEYRDCTGAYSGTKVNSFRAMLWTGGIKTRDIGGTLHETTELVDVMVRHSIKDQNKSPNYSASGLQRGVIPNAEGVLVDFGAPSMTTEYGQMYKKGINAVVTDWTEDQGNIVKLNGNKTLWVANELLNKINVAEYLVWLYRMVQPKVKYQQFNPNDPTMWLDLYNEIKPILIKSASKEMRAIYDWRYVGDQFVQNAADATYNTLEDISNGIYKFRILIKPTPAAEWIGYEISVTSLGTDFSDVTEQ